MMLLPGTLAWLALPFAIAWVKWQQSRILSVGLPLSDDLAKEAALLGVLHPERVRIRVVDAVPMPLSSTWLGKQLARFSWMPTDIAGMALGYGIHLHSKWGVSKMVLRHELVHVGQYERLGGVGPFLKAYLRECLVEGYPNGPLEREAVQRAFEVRREDGNV